MITADIIRTMEPAERQRAAELALGRIFRMGARPSQPGDVEEYERCRAIILAASEKR
jgi:hypothetical protein